MKIPVAFDYPVCNTLVCGDYQDGIRIYNDHSIVRDNIMLDDAPNDSAHQDFIQLIPPRIINGCQNSQFAATELAHVTISSNLLHSTGNKQGITCFDGLLHDVWINDNTIVNRLHPITLCGLMSGKLGGNMGADGLVPILLEPLRIGGCPEGGLNLYVVGFKAGSPHDYEPLELIVTDYELTHVTDNRRGHIKPRGRYLADFDVIGFQQAAFERQHTPLELQELAIQFSTLI